MYKGNLYYFLFLIIIFITNHVQAQDQPPSKVRVDKVQAEEIQEHAKVTGSLRAISRSEVASEEAGKIITVYVDEADEVDEGEILIRMDDKRLQISKNQAQAELNSSQAILEARQAELDNAIWNRDRLKRLYEREMTTEQSLQEAETAVAVSRAQVNSTQRTIEQLKSNIDLLTIRLEDMVIKAPFDGRVVSRQVDPGEWIDPGDPTITIISRGEIEAWLEVPERLKPPVKEYANNFQINVFENTKPVQSLNSRVIPEVDPRARTFYLIANIDTEDGMLVPGMSVTAWVPAGKTATYKTVSKDALLRNPTGFYLFKAQQTQNGYIAVPVNVEVLFDSEGRTAIESAEIQAGDMVVIEGNERLMPNTPIEFIDQ